MCHTYLQIECWQHVGGVLRILVPRAVASPPWRGYPGARARERKKRRSVACGNTSGYRPTRDSEAGRTPSAGAPPELLWPRDHIPQPKALISAQEGPATVPARMLSAPLTAPLSTALSAALSAQDARDGAGGGRSYPAGV